MTMETKTYRCSGVASGGGEQRPPLNHFLPLEMPLISASPVLSHRGFSFTWELGIWRTLNGAISGLQFGEASPEVLAVAWDETITLHRPDELVCPGGS